MCQVQCTITIEGAAMTKESKQILILTVNGAASQRHVSSRDHMHMHNYIHSTAVYDTIMYARRL